MSEQGTCSWCGGPIPPRLDPRGRKPRFCSDACRAAATRDRNKREHAAELEQARTQMVLPVESLEERQDTAMDTIRETAETVLTGKSVTDSTVRLIEMARRLVDVAEPTTPPVSAPTRNRRQRRRAVRKSGR